MSSSHNAFKFQKSDNGLHLQRLLKKKNKVNRRLRKKMITYYMTGNKRFEQKEVFTLKEIYSCCYLGTVWLSIFVNILEKNE